MSKQLNNTDHVAELIKPFPGQWVTLSADKARVLGFSHKLEAALHQAQKQGEKHPLLIKVPDSSTAAFFY